MHEMGVECGGLLSNRPVDHLRRRLVDQEQLLRGVLNRFEEARHNLRPPAETIDWNGPAQLLYSIGLLRLGGALSAAGTHLENALRETRRAISSLDDRG